ncbi:hypothetical protein C8035_v006863 [Colletotrichum spinosum]|uniref:Uncharacterized protein n=1 Tax=Colletotrichum spinosum TaxID=1347390 RepID=A0A4R8Q0U7_9PEZI|nr:hypothetical protein C8035_v006863 [Colletotrichum spinosum]
MFIPGIVQALVAALTLGIVLNAASSAVFLLAKGRGSKIFRDGLRLVLITFLASAALWAQIDFAALTIDPASTTGCQVAIIFASIFDQLARFAIEQYLLWAINCNAKTPTGGMIPQAVLGLRLVLGAVFVGFQKPQVQTVCVTRTDLLPAGVVVLIADFLVFAMLAIRANSLGLTREVKSSHGCKAILWTMVGFAAWIAGSIPMLLGIASIDLLWRTALPATALSLLVAIVTGFAESLLPSRPPQTVHPDAQSPRNITSSRDISTSDSDFPPSRYEDLKAGTITTVTTLSQSRDAPHTEFQSSAGAALPTVTGSVPGQAVLGVGGVPVQGQLFPPMRAQAALLRENKRVEARPKMQHKRSIFDRAGPGASFKNAISNPVLQQSGERNPLARIATVDLETAAKNDRMRRDNDMATLQTSSSLIAQRPAPQPPAITHEEALKRSQSVKRKEVGPRSPSTDSQSSKSAGLLSNPPAMTSSAQLSPGVEEIRRRSPRQIPDAAEQVEELAPKRPLTPPMPAIPGTFAFPPRPPRPDRPLSPFETLERTTSQRSAAPSTGQANIGRSASIRTTSTAALMTSPSATPLPPPRSAARLMSPKKPDLPSAWPIQSSVDPTIRPSRQKPLSPKGQDGGLQRRPTTGLPSNPKAMAASANQDATDSKEQTVMLVKNIQYNDPTAVRNIIQVATHQAAKTPQNAQSPGFVLKSPGSVVHRPRPIPRQQGKDRQIFPAENTLTHRRTKSGGSIISRKSILMSNPGSPTQLPPLPPPPKSAGGVLRPLPNDTKSMTFDEKMKLFFSGTPNSSTSDSRPSAMIPEMPSVPAAYQTEQGAAGEHDQVWDRETSPVHSRKSDRSTKTSIRTQSILKMDEPVQRPQLPQNTSKFSLDTSVMTGRGMADYGESWIPEALVHERARADRSQEGAKRQSSPVLPVRNPSLSEFSEARTKDEETTTNWGSIHSPAAAVNIQEAIHLPKSTWIQQRDPSVISHSDGKEVMTIMLDASFESERDPEAFAIHPSPVEDPKVGAELLNGRWHHRVGDECATFSERKAKVSSRRMPPPMPLQLKSPARKNAVVFQVAEPSPLESPQHAYEMIQAQLKKLDQPNRDSYESQGQKIRLLESLEAEMGLQENQWHEMQHGLSRDSFSTVGTTSVRDSHLEDASLAFKARLSTTVPASIAVDRRASRRARMQSGGSLSKQSYEDLRSASSTTSEGEKRGSLWQQRLADAQTEYKENAPELLAKRSVNFLSVSNARVSAQLGSPTPPDTDESDAGDAQILARLMPKERAAVQRRLWQPISPIAPEREATLLWSRGARDVTAKSVKGGVGHVPARLHARPVARTNSEPLAIDSSQLWQLDDTAAKRLRGPTAGLWRSSFVPPEPPRIQARPVTQRPPRRSRRITLLPDIVENPEPLPDKRGTLGIFQFPWGEKSDTATVQPRPSHTFMAMPGTMSTGGPAIRAALEARAKQLEAQEYSSSFFDDYDDEEEEDDDEVSDIDGEQGSGEQGSDDDFDEDTLWEIASLLQSDQVPSKYSLLPRPVSYRPESTIEDYVSQESSEYAFGDEKTGEDKEDDSKHDSIVITKPGEEQSSRPKPSILLWTAKPKRFISVYKLTGLPQPDSRTWASYMNTMVAPPPRPLRVHQSQPAVIQSTSLWSQPTKLKASASTSSLRSRPRQTSTRMLWTVSPSIVETEGRGLFNPGRSGADFKTTSASPVSLDMPLMARVTIEELPVLTSENLWQSVQRQNNRVTLWTAPTMITECECSGLFDVSHRRIMYKTTTAPPVGLGMPSIARVMGEALPELTSASLWIAPAAVSLARDWVLVASARPTRTPSDVVTSGRSTPILDTASTRSGETEAVSDFDPLSVVAVRQPAWWDGSESKMELTPAPRERLRRARASTAEWDAALTEAVGTTTTSAGVARSTSSPPQWMAAFDEAMSVSSTAPPATDGPAEQQIEQEQLYIEQQQLEQQEYEQRMFEQSEFERYTYEQQQYEQAQYAQGVEQEDSASPEPEQVMSPALPIHASQTPRPLWSAPAPTVPGNTESLTWIPPTKPPIHAHDTTPLTPEDAVSRHLRLKRIHLQSATRPVSFEGQFMWNAVYGTEISRVVPRGDGRNWLEVVV